MYDLAVTGNGVYRTQIPCTTPSALQPTWVIELGFADFDAVAGVDIYSSRHGTLSLLFDVILKGFADHDLLCFERSGQRSRD